MDTFYQRAGKQGGLPLEAVKAIFNCSVKVSTGERKMLKKMQEQVLPGRGKNLLLFFVT
ncbi:hypothetical protein D3C72_1979530 [compost metagenome]